MKISKASLTFLADLEKNNNRDWFNERKPIFKGHETEAKQFLQAVADRLNQSDQIERHKLYRIYRDVRFSKNKAPYKCRFAGGFTRATAARRGGYYINIQPGNSLIGGGFYSPKPADLMRIRKEFETNDSEIRSILADKTFKKYFGQIDGEEVKTAPRGFDVNHKAIDLIRKKQFYVFRSFTDKEVCSPSFLDEVSKTYLAIRPYFDYMSDVLTTNLNGESLLK